MSDRFLKNIESHPCIQREASNPVLTPDDVPYPASLVFNAGVIKHNGEYIMIFRNDYGSNSGEWDDFVAGKRGCPGFQGTNIGLARSKNGIHWSVEPKPVFQLKSTEIHRAYDPRLTVIDGRFYLCFAVDTRHGIRGGIAVSDDLEKFDILHMTVPDNRNMVMFPEKINGRFVRLERPFPIYGRGGGQHFFDVWLSESPDCVYWGKSDLVLGTEDVSWVNDKIGPASPPLYTDKGWLVIFHGVDKDDARGRNGWEVSWKKRYSAGVMLLDLKDPRKRIGMAEKPLIVAEADYEISGGFRNNVIFPCGNILEDDGTVKIYYGAADTYVCLATAKLNDLLDMCLQ